MGPALHGVAHRLRVKGRVLASVGCVPGQRGTLRCVVPGCLPRVGARIRWVARATTRSFVFWREGPPVMSGDRRYCRVHVGVCRGFLRPRFFGHWPPPHPQPPPCTSRGPLHVTKCSVCQAAEGRAHAPPSPPAPRMSAPWAAGLSFHNEPPPPRVTFRRVVVPLRGPGQSPARPFACCVGLLLSVGRCGRCSCWCRFRVRGAPPPKKKRSSQPPLRPRSTVAFPCPLGTDLRVNAHVPVPLYQRQTLDGCVV